MTQDSARPASQTRRTFLKTTGATAALAGGLATVGTAAARGIPTPRLHRDGKWMKDPSGNEVTLRGVNVIDPARAAAYQWRRSVSETIKHATNPDRDWYSRVIRLPMQPADIASGGEGNGARAEPVAFSKSTLQSYLDKYVQPVVETAREIGVYLILDYHRHKMMSLKYTDPDLDEEVRMFWETVAARYAEEPHVLFEVYNEPISPYYGFRERGVSAEVANPDDEHAEQTWRTWRTTAQPWVDTIRENAPHTPILIGSPRWSQWTWWADELPFDGENLAYTGHVYAHPGLRPLSTYFGKPAKTVPVFMTEFGYAADGNKYFQGTNDHEGQEFVTFFENFPNVSWQVWCFDHIWSPPMFEKPGNGVDAEWVLLDGNTHHGKFFRDYLKEKRSNRLPEGSGTTTTPTETTPTGSTPTETTTTETGGPSWPTDPPATDPDGDGLYEDLSGNGEVDFPDVNMLFQNSDTAKIRDNAQYYDFESGDGITLQDVMALFRLV
ncbi:MAG: glycoside hydrolase family 5 protein [Halococcoides sp.]